MITNQLIKRGVVLCIGHGEQNESFENPNQNLGEINHFVFGLNGTGKVVCGKKEISLKAGQLSDLRVFVGQKLQYTLTDNSEWIAFNSLLNRDISVDILTESPSVPLKNINQETIFISLKGNVNINNHLLKQHDSGRLFKGKEATVQLDNHSICALITFN